MNTEGKSEDDEASPSKKPRTRRSTGSIDDIIEKQQQEIRELEQKLKDEEDERWRIGRLSGDWKDVGKREDRG